MGEWFTTFNRACLDPKLAKVAMLALYKVAKLEKIPLEAHWHVSVRSFGIIVFAVWEEKSIR